MFQFQRNQKFKISACSIEIFPDKVKCLQYIVSMIIHLLINGPCINQCMDFCCQNKSSQWTYHLYDDKNQPQQNCCVSLITDINFQGWKQRPWTKSHAESALLSLTIVYRRDAEKINESGVPWPWTAIPRRTLKCQMDQRPDESGIHCVYFNVGITIISFHTQ